MLALVAEHQAILGTCHLSPAEIVALVREARDVGVEKIVVTHPFFKVPNLDLDTVEEVARLGAMPEFGYCTISPAWQYAAPEKIVAAIGGSAPRAACWCPTRAAAQPDAVGGPARVFAQTIFEKGVSEQDVLTMIGRSSHDLLDLDSADAPPRPVDLADPCLEPAASPGRTHNLTILPQHWWRIAHPTSCARRATSR